MNIPEFIDSRFRFTIMVARRAKQLINGAPKMVDVKAENPLTVAIEEVSSGKVSYETINGVGVYFNEDIVSEEEGEGNSEVISEETAVSETEKEQIVSEIDNQKVEEPLEE